MSCVSRFVVTPVLYKEMNRSESHNRRVFKCYCFDRCCLSDDRFVGFCSVYRDPYTLKDPIHSKLKCAV